MAFVNYKPSLSLSEMEFVGFKYFVELFADPRFVNAFQNTIIMSFLGILLCGFVMPIMFALIINEVGNMMFKRVAQTISYLPHFVSWVVVSGIVLQVLSPETGIVNEILIKLNIIQAPIHFIAIDKYFYGIATISELWKELGWSAIIFISAIAGIDQEMYEAAEVDGAGRFRKMWSITLPSIKPTIMVILIISVGGLISTGFEKQFLLSNPLTIDKAEVIDLYALNYGINMVRFSFGTAVGIFKSLVSVTLMLVANAASKKYTEQSLW